MVVQSLCFKGWWVPASWRASILRAFGAEIGRGVLIRHDVTIHWPWKLAIGDHSWIGQGAWILNLEPVRIGHDTCISQGVLLCTGSHQRDSPSFEFDNAPIEVGNDVWIAVRATVLRGVHIGDSAVIGACALVTRDVAERETVLAPAGSNTSS
jgi:putative colanic acid biosynthesis acetyltransferase WcaF